MIFKNKILNTFREVGACKSVYQKPAEIMQGIIANLRAALATVKRPSAMLQSVSAYLRPNRARITSIIDLFDQSLKKNGNSSDMTTYSVCK